MENPCEGCTVLNDTENHTFCMGGHGPLNARVFVCGEAPGREEDEEGIPFVGRAGRLLRREWRSEVGFPLDEAFVTNVVKCRPYRNRTPRKAEIVRCSPFLDRELTDIRPLLVVAVGSPAATQFGIRGKITQNSGKVFQSKDERYEYIIPIIHPSYVLQKPREISLFKRSLAAIKGFLDHGHKIDYGEYEVVEINDYDSAEKLLNEVEARGHAAVDIETNGLDVFMEEPRIKCIAFSTESRRGVTIPLEGWDSDQYNPLLKRIKEILENPNIKKSGQRLAFERKWLAHKLGINLRGIWWDTRIGAFELDKLRDAGLKEWAWRVGMGGYERVLDKRVDKMEGKTLFEYCAMDVDAEHRLIEVQQRLLSKKQRRYIRKLAIPLLTVFSDLHLRGLRVDQERLNLLEERGQELIQMLRERLLKNKYIRKVSKHGPYGEFNPNAGRHVQYLLFGILGAEVRKKTPGGSPSVDSEVLNGLVEMFPTVVGPLLQYRKIQKFYTTYIKGLRRHIAPDGRIHATFSQTTARSGRSATEKPNVQNWPHLPSYVQENFPEKYWCVFQPRTIIISDPGMELWSADFGQQELRVAAAISKDAVMTKAFMDGEDIHDRTARVIFGIGGEDNVSDEQRRVAKTINFGIIYGITAWELHRRLGIPEKDCAEFIRGFLSTYKGYSKWTQTVIDFVNEHGYVESPTGRTRNFPPIDQLEEKDRAALYREAINTPIQGSAYDLCAMALVRIEEEAKKQRMQSHTINTIHDSVMFMIHPDERDDFIQMYNELATNPPDWMSFLGDIPLVVDWATGPRWGEERKVKV